MFSVYSVTEDELFFECKEDIDNLNHSLCDNLNHSLCELLTKCRYYDNVMDDPVNPSDKVNFDIDLGSDSNFFNALKTNCKYYAENSL